MLPEGSRAHASGKKWLVWGRLPKITTRRSLVTYADLRWRDLYEELTNVKCARWGARRSCRIGWASNGHRPEDPSQCSYCAPSRYVTDQK